VTYLCPEQNHFNIAGIKGTSLWIHPKAGTDPKRLNKNFLQLYGFGKSYDQDAYLNEGKASPFKAKYQYTSLFFDYNKESGKFKTQTYETSISEVTNKIFNNNRIIGT